MSSIVRQAVANDVGLLAALNEVVQKLHVEAEPGHFRAQADRAEVEAFFANLMRTPKTFIFIAELSRRAVGYLWSELQERPATPFTHAQPAALHPSRCGQGRSAGLGRRHCTASGV